MNISFASCLAGWRPLLPARLRTCSVPRPVACFWHSRRFSVQARRSLKSTSANARKRLGFAGRDAAKRRRTLDAAGAALGSFGLLAFGAAIWLLAPRSAWLALLVGSAAW